MWSTTMPESEKVDTTAVTAGRGSIGRSLAPVLWPSTTYTVDEVAEHAAMVGDRGTTGFYSRFASPSVRDFEDAVAALEGAEAAIASSSGMGSVSAVILGLCSQGDHVVATRQVFSVTYALFTFHLPRFGIDVTLVDGTDPAAIADAVIPGRTQIVFVETPANPALSLVDMGALGAIAGPITVVDSTFAGPVVQRPLDHGVDLVLHAATKGIAGHNDSLLGVVAGNADLIEPIWAFQSALGTQASPFDSWNGVRGIRTLPVRSRHQSTSALAIARALEAHPRVRSVSYPFLESHPQHELAKQQMTSGGTVVTFEVDGPAEDTVAVIERCRVARIALSLGGPETLLTHPATIARRFTPDERAELGISDSLVRLSVGLEDPDDLIHDLTQALDAPT
jgi:cystathionine beta-lyase/cystathionine gamma-synthase